MLAKRIIPCLDIKDGQTVKGTNFVNLRQAGDPVELGKAYSEQGADELVYLDITASHEGRKTFTELVKRISAEINIPFTVGGGIHELSDVERLLNAGADKVSINLRPSGTRSSSMTSPAISVRRYVWWPLMPDKPRKAGNVTSTEEGWRPTVSLWNGRKKPTAAEPGKSCLPAWTTTG